MCFTCFPLSRSRGGTSVLFLSFVVQEKDSRGERRNIFKWVTASECEARSGRRISVKNFNFIMLIKISLNLSGRVLAAIWAVSLNCIPVHLFLSTKSVPIKKSHRVINSLFFFCRWQSLTPEMIMKRWCNSIRVVKWPKRAIKTLKGGP